MSPHHRPWMPDLLQSQFPAVGGSSSDRDEVGGEDRMQGFPLGPGPGSRLDLGSSSSSGPGSSSRATAASSAPSSTPTEYSGSASTSSRFDAEPEPGPNMNTDAGMGMSMGANMGMDLDAPIDIAGILSNLSADGPEPTSSSTSTSRRRRSRPTPRRATISAPRPTISASASASTSTPTASFEQHDGGRTSIQDDLQSLGERSLAQAEDQTQTQSQTRNQSEDRPVPPAPSLAHAHLPAQPQPTHQPMPLPPGLQSLLMGMMAAMNASNAGGGAGGGGGVDAAAAAEGSGADGMGTGRNGTSNVNGNENGHNNSASGSGSGSASPNPNAQAQQPTPDQPPTDPRATFQRQFAHFANNLHLHAFPFLQSHSSPRSDPERAEELLKGLKDPGKGVLRRLVRLCEVESRDARVKAGEGEEEGEEVVGMQCGICLDTVVEIFEREQEQEQEKEKATKRDGEEGTLQADETKRGDDGSMPGGMNETEEVEVDPESTGSAVTPDSEESTDSASRSSDPDTPEMQDVEMLLDGQKPVCKSEDTTFRAFPCHHMFCQECLLPWLATHTTCPTCRLDIDPHSVTLRRPVSRQSRDNTLRPGATRAAMRQAMRLEALDRSGAQRSRPWRMMRVSPSAPLVPMPTANGDSNRNVDAAANASASAPGEEVSIANPAAAGDAMVVDQEPVGGAAPASASPRAETEGPQDTMGTQADAGLPGHPGNNPMGNLTIVFLTGDGQGQESPHNDAPAAENGQNNTPFGSMGGQPPSSPAGGLVMTFGTGHPPPNFGRMPGDPNSPLVRLHGDNDTAPSDSDAEQQSNAGTTPNRDPGLPRMPPVLFAFGQNMNPFAPQDVMHVRSDAVWNPPAPKSSLRQWLHKRERDLGIVCDDPHCKRVDVQSDLDGDSDNSKELMRLNGFSTFDALCEHRFHEACLVQANTFNEELHPLDSERAVLRCPQCRKQGWAAISPA